MPGRRLSAIGRGDVLREELQMQPVGDATCFLCGLPGADTRDHVVPKAFYTPPLPDDLITLPAHLACNRSTSKDEEWISIGLSAARPIPDKGDARYEKAKRSLLREEAPRLRQAFLDAMIPHQSGGATLDLGNLRVRYVLAKIVKGLLFHQAGRLLTEHHTWVIKSIKLPLMVERAPAFPHLIEVHDVALFRWQEWPDSIGPTVFWDLALFNMHIFSGVTVSPLDFDQLVTRLDWLKDGVCLPWPKPKTVVSAG
jgi:hypothetical protein